MPLTDLNDIVFGGWDIFPDNAYEAAMSAEVLKEKDQMCIRDRDNPAVEFVRRMIEHRDDHSPNEKDFWQRDRYEKTTFALRCV